MTTLTPTRHYEGLIRDAYGLIRQYQDLRVDSDDPKEQRRLEREVREQWALIEGYLEDYLTICEQSRSRVPDDIQELAVRFPRFAARDIRQTVAVIDQGAPAAEALPALDRFLRALAGFHARLLELKELHNLLQDCTTAILPLRGELEAAIDRGREWRKASGLRLWSACRGSLQRLEGFAQELRFVDVALQRGEGMLQGPAWMIQILALRKDLDACLREGDAETAFGLTIELWDTCYDALERADKQLRTLATELQALSQGALVGGANGVP